MKATVNTGAQRNLGLTNAMRTLREVAVTVAVGIGLMAACVTAQAAVVNAVFTNLGGGGGHYSAAVEVVNDGSPASLSGFTLYFSEARFTNLQLTASPSTWDSLLIPPDLGIPAAGFLDAFVLDPLDALQLGQTQAGFNFTFDYIGQGLPGAMSFDINDAVYNVLFSGVSTDTYVTTNRVPEPGTGWLVLIALGCIAGANCAKNNKGIDSARALAGDAA